MTSQNDKSNKSKWQVSRLKKCQASETSRWLVFVSWQNGMSVRDIEGQSCGSISRWSELSWKQFFFFTAMVCSRNSSSICQIQKITTFVSNFFCDKNKTKKAKKWYWKVFPEPIFLIASKIKPDRIYVTSQLFHDSMIDKVAQNKVYNWRIFYKTRKCYSYFN
jgi:hypothetical protein